MYQWERGSSYLYRYPKQTELMFPCSTSDYFCLFYSQYHMWITIVPFAFFAVAYCRIHGEPSTCFYSFAPICLSKNVWRRVYTVWFEGTFGGNLLGRWQTGYEDSAWCLRPLQVTNKLEWSIFNSTSPFHHFYC